MLLSEFKQPNEGEPYVFDLMALDKNLKHKSDDYERLEYLESEKTKHLELATHCQLQIDKIEKLHKYKNEYDLRPSSSAHVTNEKPKKSDSGIKNAKTFPQFLLHEKREALAQKLKSEFTTEKSKKMRLIIEVMQYHDPALISIGTRNKKNLYFAMKVFFSRDIGSYQGIFDYNFSPETDKEDLESIETRMNFLLGSL